MNNKLKNAYYQIMSLEEQNDLLGEQLKNKIEGGLFDLDNEYIKRCNHPEHNPPNMIYIPPGKGYKHICPACGTEAILIPPQISF